MGTTHFALNQVHHVLRWEREDINEEWLRLSVWVSLLMQWTTSEKEKAEAWQKHLDVMEVLYSRRQAVADKLDAQTQKLLHDTKELYATAESRANATIKQQEDLNAQPAATAQLEQAAAEQEMKLWEREV
jgi:viroplasmin and RNaseH domain-containing protein